MEDSIRNKVVSLLEGYTEKLRGISLLRYELEHPSHISADDMLDTMSFARGDGTGRGANTVSNKTMYIAMNYQEAAEKANVSSMDDIVTRLMPLQHEIDRLQHYVSLLNERQALVIKQFYFEGRTWEEIARALQATDRTAQKLRNIAIDELVRMYSFTEGLH